MSCNKPLQNLERYHVIEIEMHETIIIDEKLSNEIINKLINSKKNGLSKGMKISILLANKKDTIRVVSFGGSKYFQIGNSFYESNQPLLPDSILYGNIW